jgi:hypothetical protein
VERKVINKMSALTAEEEVAVTAETSTEEDPRPILQAALADLALPAQGLEEETTRRPPGPDHPQSPEVTQDPPRRMETNLKFK